MSKEALKIISDAMKSLKINYAFMEWKKKPEYPYFVGEYTENPPIDEDGMQETTFLITGFSRESWDALENTKEKIAAYFNKVGGRTVIADSGSAVAVFYLNSLVVPTGDSELKKIQINLSIKEWSVN